MSKSGIKGKITEVLRLQPHKPCNRLSDKELIEEEAHCRKELIRLVLSLSIHVGTCTTHGVLSAGTTLPIHVPVVVWVAYSLTKVAKRHRALRVEMLTQRKNIRPQKFKAKRYALPVVLGLISPILSALGADILNDIVLTLIGSDALFNLGMPGKETFVDFDCSGAPDSNDIMQVVTAGDINNSQELNLTEQLGEAAIQEVLEKWIERMEKGMPDDFAQLIEELQPENIISRAGIILPNNYQIYCDVCAQQINDGFSCLECHDLDLCRDCFVGMKHQDVRSHEYEEFKIEEEITQIQRIMASLRRGNITVASRRGGFVKCNKCSDTLSTPSTNFKSDPVYYYSCKGCDDFDVCLKCFPKEVSGPAHKDHSFVMTVATDDEATISRLSPTTSTLPSPRSPGGTSPGTFQYLPTPSPRSGSYTSLFGPHSISRTATEPSLSPTASSTPTRRVSSEQGAYRVRDVYCDACHLPIETNQHWRCFDPDCTASSSMDLHLHCRDQRVGIHRSHHDMRLVST